MTQASNSDVSGWEAFNPKKVTKEDAKSVVEALGDDKASIAQGLYELITFLTQRKKSALNADGAEGESVTGNPFIDVINFIFGTQGVLDMRGKNAALHPIAQLSALGQGIVSSAIRNLGISTGLSSMGGIIASFEFTRGKSAIDMANSIFSTTAYIGLTAGINLYYIVPILPFVFFFFAISGWLKGIFEAMVGVPLWALAHLRIDGEGLPGQAAMNGYLLLFEAFLRPILIVFGLIFGMLIFAMEVRLLNLIWDLVFSNVGGGAGGTYGANQGSFDPNGNFSLENVATVARSTVDEFFYTVMYSVIVYMMGTAAFKMIDRVPDGIMRWLGGGVTAFGESDKNPSEQLSSLAVRGGMMQGQRLVQSGQMAASGLGNALGPKPPTPPAAPAA